MTSRPGNAVDAYFGLKEKGSNIRTEVMAGASTFLVLSYIFFVNPAILADAGMDKGAVFFATVVASGLATIAMGLWARLPFVLAPGMEMNAYVAYFAVAVVGLSWQEALGAVFWSGVLFVILTLTSIREKIIASIPDPMKDGLSLAVGVFLALIAGKITGVLEFEGIHLAGMGDWATPSAVGLYVGVAAVVLLDRLNFRGAVIASVVLSSVVCHLMGLGGGGEEVQSAGPFSAVGVADLSVIFSGPATSIIIVLFLVDFYGSVAKIVGLSAHTSIQVAGRVPRLRQALLVDSVGTSLASLLGTTNLTVYVESGVGIGTGGRTGLTAVTCGVLMMAMLVISPLVKLVPLAATAGALVFVALKMIPARRVFMGYGMVDVVCILLMQVVVIVTFALDRAVLVGLTVYLVRDLAAGKKPSRYVVLSVVLLGVGWGLQ